MKRVRSKARRYLAAALALMLCLSLLPMSAMANDSYYEIDKDNYHFKIDLDTGYTSITQYTVKNSDGYADISGNASIPGTVTYNGKPTPSLR